jgi:hypothetical protein
VTRAATARVLRKRNYMISRGNPAWSRARRLHQGPRMKQTAKKLSISKETVRGLSQSALNHAKGAAELTYTNDCTYTCGGYTCMISDCIGKCLPAPSHVYTCAKGCNM